MSFVIIVHRPTQYLNDDIEQGVLSFQNKYSLGDPFIVHQKQIILLDKLGYNYINSPENFNSFNVRFILIFFSARKINIKQFFYRDTFASQQQIYFNALNNYDVDYIYTNVATPVRAFTNTLENIYAVQGIPLSFIDDTNIKYVYTRPHGVNFLGPQYYDPYTPGLQDYNYKEKPNGERYITDNYRGPLAFQQPKYNPSFDKLIIYNRGNPCRYLLMNGLNWQTGDGSSFYVPQTNIATINLTNSYIAPTITNTIYTENEYPQIFDLPATFNMAHKYTKYDGGDQILYGAQVLINDPNQTLGALRTGNFPWDFDLIEKASSTLCGNNNLVFNYPAIDPNQFKDSFTPRIKLTRSDLFENTQFDLVRGSIKASQTQRATYTFTFPVNYQSTTNNIGIYLPYQKSIFTTDPDVIYTFSNFTKSWTERLYTSGTPFRLENVNIIEWSKTKYDSFTKWYVPSPSNKISIMVNNIGKDLVSPSAYILKNLNGAGNLSFTDIKDKQVSVNSYGFRAKKVNEYMITDLPNQNYYEDLFINAAGYFWAGTGLEIDFVKTTIKNSKDIFDQIMNPDEPVDITTKRILEMAFLNNFQSRDTIKFITHAVDDKPFSLGMRMLQSGFDYKNYFQARHFPKLILKKTFRIDVDPTKNLPAVITSPIFNLNSLQVKDYHEVSCFLLPDLSSDSGLPPAPAIPRGKFRGLALKCSLAKTIRGEGQYLFFETGKSYIMNYQRFINSSSFFIEIFCPQVLPVESTLFRTINTSRNFTFFLFFK